jgi:hypothetical protein
VSALPGRGLEIRGAATSDPRTPDARVSGEATDLKRYGATVGKNVRFVLEMPAATAPELIAISEESGRRQLKTDGYLFVPPDAPDHAVVLRAGVPSRALQAGLIGTIDFDSGGGVAIAGVATPGAAVDVSVDGKAVARATADGQGFWEARLGVDKPGSHQVRVSSRGLDVVDRAFDFTAGTTTQIYTATREPDGWRIAWAMPGGGVQTTLLLLGASRS